MLGIQARGSHLARNFSDSGRDLTARVPTMRACKHAPKPDIRPSVTKKPRSASKSYGRALIHPELRSANCQATTPHSGCSRAIRCRPKGAGRGQTDLAEVLRGHEHLSPHQKIRLDPLPVSQPAAGVFLARQDRIQQAGGMPVVVCPRMHVAQGRLALSRFASTRFE